MTDVLSRLIWVQTVCNSYQQTTLNCKLGIFYASFVVCRLFSKQTFFQKFFQEHDQSVKQFGSRSDRRSGSKLFATVICRRQNSLVARKKLNVHKRSEMSRLFLFFLSGGSFLYPHTYGVRPVKAQARLCICTGSQGYSLVAYTAIGSLSSHAPTGSYLR